MHGDFFVTAELLAKKVFYCIRFLESFATKGATR